MSFLSVSLPPGIGRNGTARQNKGRWYDCNMVRWSQGLMQPIGGWERATSQVMERRICGLHSWFANMGNPFIAVGTANKLFVYEGGSLSDVTPDGLRVAGDDSAQRGVGFGAAAYNDDAYNTPRESETRLVLEAPSWSADSFGSLLVGVLNTDGRVAQYDPGDTDIAQATFIPNAPVDNQAVITTNERHLMVIGADGRRDRIAWSNREQIDNWAFSDQTSLAGFLNINTDGRLLTAMRVGPEILVMSDVDAFRVSYVGATLVYGAERVGTNCGVVGARAVAATDTFVAWMSDSGFYIYDGYVKSLPCEVQDWVFRDFNILRGSQVVAGRNSRFDEIWWFFASSESTTNNRYVTWNYRENTWAIGYFGRDAWLSDGVTEFPFAGGELPSGYTLFRHEVGFSAAGVPRSDLVYAETAPIEIGNGDRTLYVTRIVPDPDEESTAPLQYVFKARQTPSTQETVFGPFRRIESGFINTRFAARQFRLRVSATSDGDWRLGNIRLDVKPGGGR